MRHALACCLAVLVVLGGCGPREPAAPSGAGPDPSDPDPAASSVTLAPAEIRNAPLEATVQGAPLRIGAELWRDFMPISPPEGRPLTGVVWVWAADRAAAGPFPDADRCWVVHGDSAWATVPIQESPPAESDSVLARYALREGPFWGPGVPVDVILRLGNEGGAPILLRAAGVEITRTD